MKRYFTEPVPEGRGRVLNFEDLAEAYRTATIGPQLDGILHDVARRGDRVNTSRATSFLLQIASEAEIIESDESRRKLALGLFIQRVLPQVDYRDSVCREYILRFFAREPELRVSSNEHVQRFLSQSWLPGLSERQPIDRELLVDATFGVGLYDLLAQHNVLEAIIRLYDLLAMHQEIEKPGLILSFWSELSDSFDLANLQKEMLRNKSVYEQFRDDCVHIILLCSGSYGKGKDRSMKSAARALDMLVSMLLSLVLR
ncbi:hypothetical protein KJ937_03870 [Patescibacteria group bacterium]|nr:hypothetical protein [Patescibacteria group bacterium]